MHGRSPGFHLLMPSHSREARDQWPIRLSAIKMWYTVAGTAPEFCFTQAPVFPFNLLMKVFGRRTVYLGVILGRILQLPKSTYAFTL
jgi:hypothetical protein